MSKVVSQVMEAYRGGNLLKTILVLALLVSTAIGTSSAQTVISIESAEDISIGSTTWINVTAVNISDPDGIGSYRFNLTFDPTVVNVLDIQSPLGTVTKNINNEAGWAKFNQFFTEGVKTNGTILARIQLKAMRGDGASAPLNLTIERLYDPQSNPIPAIAINGTFTTLDETPPSITFDKTNGSTVGPNIDVTATLYDLSGINESSIEVYINGTNLINGYTVTKINNTTWNVSIKTNVSELLNVSLPHDVEIMVKASDTKGNSATAVLIVTAANIGFFNPYPPDNGYINTRNVTISVKYSQIDPDTIKMYLDGQNKTKYIYKDNSTVQYTATNLNEGIHTVKVNGTGVDGKEWSLTWNFTVDVTPPSIIDFVVRDSDGDGFIERFENLTAYWNVSDSNFDRVEIVYNGNIVKTNYSANSSATFSLTEYGGKIKLIAYDKAGNKEDSSEIGREYYVYNNYLAYAEREQRKAVMGLNVTKLATLDLMDRDIVNVTIFNGTEIKLPVSKVERRIITGTKAKYTVYVDRNANKTITNFYQNFVVLDANTMLDFYVKAPARALLMVIRLNDSKAENLAKEFAEKWSVKGLIKLDELDEYIYNVPHKAGVYLFDVGGWRGVRVSKDGSVTRVGGAGDFGPLYTKLKDNIIHHQVDLSKGFRLSNCGYSRPKLEPGAYVLLAIGLDGNVSGDNYIVSLNAMMPIIVVNGTLSDNKPSINDSVTVGDTIRIEFPSWVNRTTALMIMDKTYQADITVNMTKAWHHIARLNITYPGKDLRELMYKDKHTKIWIPKRMGKGAYKKSNVISIDTSGLDEGNYIIYIVAQEYGGIVYYAGVLTVSVMRDTVPPTISVDAKPKEVWLEFNGTGYKPNTTTISFTVSDKSGVKKVIVEIWNETEMLYNTTFNARNDTSFSESVTFTVSLPGTYTAIVKAWDAYGNYNETKVNFYGIGYYPVTITVPKNKTTEVQVSKDVNVTIVASPTANATVNLTVQESTTNETFKISATEGVVKYINVSGVAENVSVLLLKFRYENVRPFVYWWNKSKADWENVTDYTYDYDKTLIFNVTKLALDKGYTNLTDFLKDPVFALVAKLPDLTVVNIITPDNMVEGNTYSITVKVKNIGTANATAFNVTLFVNGKQIGKKTVTLLNISEVKDVTFSWTPSSSGTFTLKAVVDPENVVKELNEANNMKFKSVTVKSKVVHVLPAGGGGGGGYIITAPPIVAKPVVEFKTTEYFTAEKPKTITLPLDKSDKIGIVSVTAKVPFSISLNVIITKAELPATIPSPKYNVYTFVEIAFYKGTGELVKPSGEIEFKVSKSWMNEKGYSKDQIVLMKYEKVWKELPTEYVKEDTNYYYFKAKVSSFSIFAIAAKPKVVITPTTPPVTVTTTVPPTVTTTVIPPPPYTTYAIIAVIVIVIIAVIAYAIARRR